MLGGLFTGGATASARGVRMMATGLAKEWFNTADVSSADADAQAIAEFYASRGLRYGVRVPAGMAWAHGVRVVRLRLMFVLRGALLAVEPPPAVRIEAAQAEGSRRGRGRRLRGVRIGAGDRRPVDRGARSRAG